MLCARSYAGRDDRVAIAYEPTYPLYRVAVWVTGADVGEEEPVLTFVCRPHNPTGAMVDLPAGRPLVVDEAYVEYGGETAVPLIESAPNLIVLRTLSKAFGLAALRVGYALADAAVAAELNERQQPAPVSTLSAALALAALEAGPPDVSATIAERERLAEGLRSLGLSPLPSSTNFLLVPHERAEELYAALLARGLAVRPSPDAIRITVHRPGADDRLLDALAALVDG
jgi:histidinol-phosphate aminotransferase